MNKLKQFWINLRSGLWFVPALMVGTAIALALGFIELDTHVSHQLLQQWPRLFGVGADGSRSMLSTIAGSMITVTGVIFSITIVALVLASSQYSPRILRNFMRSRANQVVLGVFVGVFSYCIVVLRTIRGGDENAYVPSLAVLFGVVLALIAIGVLIFFIHHIASSIQASSILAAIAKETFQAIDELFPDKIGVAAHDCQDEQEQAINALMWHPVTSTHTGYIQSIDTQALFEFACKHNIVLRMDRAIGEFVFEGGPLVSLSAQEKADARISHALQRIYTIGHYRSIEQDPAFGIRQIVDIAMKALSPGINDTTTAVTCVDYLTAIIARLASRRIEIRCPRFHDDELRMFAKGPDFDSLLALAFDQIRQNASGNVAVMLALLDALETISRLTHNAPRRRLLLQQVNFIAELAERSIENEHDRATVRVRGVRVTKLLEQDTA